MEAISSESTHDRLLFVVAPDKTESSSAKARVAFFGDFGPSIAIEIATDIAMAIVFHVSTKFFNVNNALNRLRVFTSNEKGRRHALIPVVTLFRHPHVQKFVQRRG